MEFECLQCGFKMLYDEDDRTVNFCPNCGHIANDLLDKVAEVFDRFFVNKRFKDATRLYRKREYSHAAKSAVVMVENYLKEKSGDKVDVLDAIADLFSYDYDMKSLQMLREPKIKINSLSSQVERNEQDGIKLIFFGLIKGLRNPLIHTHEKITAKRAFLLIMMSELLLDLMDNGSIAITRKVVPKKVHLVYGDEFLGYLRNPEAQIIVFYTEEIQINFFISKDAKGYKYGKEMFRGDEPIKNFVLGSYDGDPVYCLFGEIDRSCFEGSIHVVSVNGYLYIGKKDLRMFVGDEAVIQSRL